MNWHARSRFRLQLIAAVVTMGFSGMLLEGCGRRAVSSVPVGHPIVIAVPLGLPPVPVPFNNPPTTDTIALGCKLFYDTALSNQSSLSCASCHLPSHGFSDPHAVSVGFHDALGLRNASSLLNVAYLPLQFWDGRAKSLEEQVMAPVLNPTEMGNTARDVLTNLKKNPEYTPLFQAAFGSPEITAQRVENAIASYERTLLSGNSAFDKYEYGGDKTALNPQQIRGLAIFLDTKRGNCASCHTINDHFALFTDGKFHNIGEGVSDDGKFDDAGRFDATHESSDRGAFMTPTLRDIAQTAPYMHDGKVKTLAAVVDFYAGHGNSNANLDIEMQRIHLTAQDRKDLVAFLESLTGSSPDDAKPMSGKAVDQ